VVGVVFIDPADSPSFVIDLAAAIGEGAPDRRSAGSTGSGGLTMTGGSAASVNGSSAEG